MQLYTNFNPQIRVFKGSYKVFRFRDHTILITIEVSVQECISKMVKDESINSNDHKRIRLIS